jgi:cGMP-dependent protein kinase 1
MTDSQKDSITHVTITQVFKKGDWVVSEGDEATSYYIIKKGSVMAVKGGQDVRKMVII